MPVKALAHKKIIKKKITKFVRHEFNDFGKLKATWRKPHGIDNPVRRRFRGQRSMVKIGFRSDKKTRYMNAGGFKPFLIRNAADLEILLMNNRTHAAVIAHNISSKNKVILVKRAAELGVRVTNLRGKMRTEEKKQENK